MSAPSSSIGELSPPWTVRETPGSLEIHHAHRWLAVVGVPLALAGLGLAVGLWWLPGINRGEAGPILVVGSLIGVAFLLMGIHLTFHEVRVVADRARGCLVRVSGVRPLVRRRSHSLGAVTGVRCSPRHLAGSRGGSVQYWVEVLGDDFSVLVAGSSGEEMALREARRWAAFLGVPLEHRPARGSRDSLRPENR